VPRDTVGELLVRSPFVMQGYWNIPEQTAEAMREGWMRTGDAGCMDAQGFVFIVDRFKDMNVYCAEVEGALACHPAMAAVAAIGVPSEAWGESVHAEVVRKSGSGVRTVCAKRAGPGACVRSTERRGARGRPAAGPNFCTLRRQEKCS
jgi:acyl-CoA synthetase (AMP-forming)/AMP-acid ligase II